jgi:hypothetical protein
MASNRNRAGPESQPTAAQLPVEEETGRQDKVGKSRLSGPRAGRTGGFGARAERPSEGTHRQAPGTQVPPGRDGKPPSPTSAGVHSPAKQHK